MKITPEFDAAADFLFSRVNVVPEHLSDMKLIVCVDHSCFIPCRKCMYNQPAGTPYSSDPEIVERVRRHQNSKEG